MNLIKFPLDVGQLDFKLVRKRLFILVCDYQDPEGDYGRQKRQL